MQQRLWSGQVMSPRAISSCGSTQLASESGTASDTEPLGPRIPLGRGPLRHKNPLVTEPTQTQNSGTWNPSDTGTFDGRSPWTRNPSDSAALRAQASLRPASPGPRPTRTAPTEGPLQARSPSRSSRNTVAAAAEASGACLRVLLR